MTAATYDVQLGDAGGVQLVVDVDFLQLDVDEFAWLRGLIRVVESHDTNAAAEPTAKAPPESKVRPPVPELKLSVDDATQAKLDVIAYADTCGSDSKAAKAFGIDDYRTIRAWRKELAND
jgi:hypothetical protein